MVYFRRCDGVTNNTLHTNTCSTKEVQYEVYAVTKYGFETHVSSMWTYITYIIAYIYPAKNGRIEICDVVG